MAIVDAGPLISLLNPRDRDHAQCLALVDTVRMPWITTLAVLTEAMHFVGGQFGWRGQRRILAMTDDGSLEIRSSSASELRRCRELMEKYRDTPMEIADASLVALAESTSVHRIFTLDRHFQAYRIHGKQRFSIVPKALG